MLQNLKAIFGRHEQWVDAWRVQCRLRMLSPGSWRERRDHAVLTLRAGRYGEAIELLEQELKVCPGEDRPFLQNHLRQARKLLPGCN
jgi:regulator of sirC expression with transglutaminase-like and TPR domain